MKNSDGEIAGTTLERLDIITDHFDKMLAPTEFIDNIRKYPKCKMKNPFNTEEINKAAKSLKNGKSCGIDQVNAELIKYAPEEVHQIIANIYNTAAETGDFPRELTHGLLTYTFTNSRFEIFGT